MPGPAFVLRGLVEAEPGPAEAALTRFDARLSGVSQSAGGSFSKMKTAGAVAFAALGVAALDFVAKSVGAFVEVANETRVLSKQLGITAEDASKLRVAGDDLGISVQTLALGLGFFEKNLGNANPKLAQYGIALRDANGDQKPFNDLLGEAADKYVSLGSGVEGTTFAMNVFGRGGKALIPLLAQGSEGIKRMGDEAERLGQVLSGQDLEAAHQFTISQQQMNEAFQGLEISIGRELVPAMTTLVHAGTDVIVFLNKVPGPVKTFTLLAIGGTGALVGLGLAVRVVRSSLAELGLTTKATAADEALLETQAGATATALEGEALAGGTAAGGLSGAGAAAGVAGAGATAGAAGISVLVGALALSGDALAAYTTRLKELTPAQRQSLEEALKYSTIQADTTDAWKKQTDALLSLGVGYGAYNTLAKQVTAATELYNAEIDRGVPKEKAYADAVAKLGLAGATAAGGIQEATDATRQQATQAEAATLAVLGQRDAELSLAGSLLGVAGSIRTTASDTHTLAADQKAVDKALRDGGKSSDAYKTALAQLHDDQFQSLQDQLQLRQSVESYAKTLEGPVNTALENYNKIAADTHSREEQRNQAWQDYQDTLAAVAPEQQKAIRLIESMGKQVGLSKDQIQHLIDKVTGYTDKAAGVPDAVTSEFTAPGLDESIAGVDKLLGLDAQVPETEVTKFTTPGLPDSISGVDHLLSSLGKLHDQSITITTHYEQVGSPPAGSPASQYSKQIQTARGAVFKAAEGFLFRAGEASYATPLGIGAELVSNRGVLPLDESILRRIGLYEASEVARYLAPYLDIVSGRSGGAIAAEEGSGADTWHVTINEASSGRKIVQELRRERRMKV